jgi:site-specific DNA recombinase
MILVLPLRRVYPKLLLFHKFGARSLERVAEYWSEAMAEERRDIVWSLLKVEGLIYNLERHVIIGLKPRVGVLPALALGLEATSMWEQREDGLWLRGLLAS